MAGKWNYKTHTYDAYDVPEGWHISMYENSLEAIINCAQCGCEMTFGSGYTSREIHSAYGMSYAVCVHCYTSEKNREKAAKEAEGKEDTDNA
ncbi:MAG: hypothetical protein WC374_04705 [Phycisphaerae bacterium]|jgi:hypothetical protein